MNLSNDSETTSGMGVRLFFQILLQHGWTLKKIEKETGLSRDTLDDPGTRVEIEKVIKLSELAFKVTENPALGIHLAENNRESPFHFITHIALSSENLLEALQHWSTYARLDADSNRVDIREEKDSFVVSYTNISRYQAVWIQELYLTQVIANCRDFVDKTINPLEARFVHQAPEYARDYLLFFRAPVLFNQKENALVLTKTDMLRSIPSSNPHLKTALRTQADLLLRNVRKTRTCVNTTKENIIRMLPHGNFTIDSISRKMSMDRTTLHRKLKKEGTSFTELLNDTRKDLARSYLNQQVSVTDISNLLGFSEPSAFQHAFKRWFGTSPSRYRKINKKLTY